MIPFNNLTTRVHAWGQSVNPETNEAQGRFKNIAATRLANFVGGGVLGVAAVVQNVFQAAFEVIFVPYAVIVNVFSYISGSDCLDSYYNDPQRIKDFFSTAFRVSAYAIATLSSISVGVISPSANYKVHCALNIITEDSNDVDPEFAFALEQAENGVRERELLRQTSANFETELQENIKKESEDDTAAEMSILDDQAAKQATEDAAKLFAEEQAAAEKRLIEEQAAAEKRLADELAAKAAKDLADKALEAAKALELTTVEPPKKLEVETSILNAVIVNKKEDSVSSEASPSPASPVESPATPEKPPVLRRMPEVIPHEPEAVSNEAEPASEDEVESDHEHEIETKQTESSGIRVVAKEEVDDIADVEPPKKKGFFADWVSKIRNPFSRKKAVEA